jgi:thymidine phosphorylase
MLLLAGREADRPAARRRLEQTITSGAAFARFQRMVMAQGGDPAVIADPALLPRAPLQLDVLADRSGVVTRVEPRALGRLIIGLGGGRREVTDAVLPDVGLMVPVKPGQRVSKGDVIATVHARSRETGTAAMLGVQQAITIGDNAPEPLPLIAWRVTRDGATSWEGAER